MSDGSERRSDARYVAHFDVRFTRASDAARAFGAFSINFSPGGLCVRSPNAYTVGETLTLSLTIEGETFELQGMVAWVRGEAVGIRFVNVKPAIRVRLEGVAQLLSTKLPPVT
ncbi:MAG: TIGR02266 family protein [Archangium gephyra]|uniref:TIGR02266 family protein n=1 Tax=Archangium gephyra TaxID=48 RepID=A0A2W5UXH1_9BACT|nr:MAG: TIGR02266 family protein [Archangium gephyra]